MWMFDRLHDIPSQGACQPSSGTIPASIAAKQFPVLLVTGARQVGKTTLLRHLSKKGRTYVTLDDPLILNLARQDPALFFRRFAPPVLIDEIQYAPGLLPYIKTVSLDFSFTHSKMFRVPLVLTIKAFIGDCIEEARLHAAS